MTKTVKAIISLGVLVFLTITIYSIVLTKRDTKLKNQISTLDIKNEDLEKQMLEKKAQIKYLKEQDKKSTEKIEKLEVNISKLQKDKTKLNVKFEKFKELLFQLSKEDVDTMLVDNFKKFGIIVKPLENNMVEISYNNKKLILKFIEEKTLCESKLVLEKKENEELRGIKEEQELQLNGRGVIIQMYMDTLGISGEISDNKDLQKELLNKRLKAINMRNLVKVTTPVAIISIVLTLLLSK
jgi:hypothetical protein